jgi:hypothetical protein
MDSCNLIIFDFQLTTFARSASEKPGVMRATISQSTALPYTGRQGILRGASNSRYSTQR